MSSSRALVLLLVVGACTEPRSADDTIRRDGEPDAVVVAAEDPELLDARDRARQTLPSFLRLLSGRDPTIARISVKVRVAEGGEVEHLWLNDLSWTGGLLVGVLANRPIALTGVAEGDTLRVDTSSVSDWMATKDGVLLGGFTLRVMRARLQAAERTAMDSSLGFRVVESVVLPDGA